MDLPPAPPPTVPEADPNDRPDMVALRRAELAKEFTVGLHADLRFAGVVERLDTLDSRVTDQDPAVVFALPFATVGADAGLGQHVLARASMRFNQMSSDATQWQTNLWDAMVDVTCGEQGNFSFGVMPVLFGVDENTMNTAIDMGGVDQYEPLGWSSGFNAQRGMGVGWKQNLGAKASADFQLHNVSGEGEATSEKTGSVRLNVDVMEGLEILASARLGLLGDDAVDFENADIALGALYTRDSLRVIAEAFNSLDESGHLAWSLSSAYGLGLGSEISRTVDLLARVRGEDPNANAGGDSRLQVAAGGNLHFNSPDDSGFSTGLIWEMDVPEDKDDAIEHELALQMRLHF